MREGSIAKIASCTPYLSKVTYRKQTHGSISVVEREADTHMSYGATPATHLVVQEEVHEPWDALGKLGELPHGFHRGALAAVEHVDSDLLGQRSTGN